MFNHVFEISYIVGTVVGSGIRAWYGKKHRQDRLVIFRKEGFITGFLASLWGIAILLPFIFIYSTWLDVANYRIPAWSGFIGIMVFGISLWLLWRSHVDLGRNWSATTEIKESQRLVTQGVFRYIRHPMYAAHLLWGIAQALLIQNYIAGLASIVVFVPLYLLRVTREERMMLIEFGDEYRAYMSRTGRIVPRLKR